MERSNSGANASVEPDDDFQHLLPRVVTLEQKVKSISAEQRAARVELNRFEARIEKKFDVAAEMFRTSLSSTEVLGGQVRELNESLGGLQATLVHMSTEFTKMSASHDAEMRITKERWEMWEKGCVTRHEGVAKELTLLRADVDSIEDQVENTGRFQLAEATTEKGRAVDEKEKLRADMDALRAENSELRSKALAAEAKSEVERGLSAQQLTAVGAEAAWWRSNTVKLVAIILGLLGAGGVGAKVMDQLYSAPPTTPALPPAPSAP
jgi:hypothetical protein